MAYCVKCGTALPDHARFCGACGTSLNDPAFDAYRSSPELTYEGPAKINSFAMAALILGIVGVCPPLPIIFGAIANGRIKRSGGREKGSGFAIAGIVLGSVWLVVGLLFALAVPTYLGAHLRTEDRIAQASLRNTLTAAKVVYTDHSDYRQATPAALTQGEPALTFIGPATDSTGPSIVSSGASGPNTFFAAAWSTSHTCWYIRDSIGGAQPGTMWNHARGLTSCRASVVPALPWSATP